MPTISIIIPTHNRCDSLIRNLNALGFQDFPLEDIEVIVVADGCVDKTVEMLQAYKAPFAFKIVEQPGQGAAAARNQGAAQANSSLLLFIDDDIEPLPQLIAAHVKAHQAQRDQVVIGYLPPILNHQRGFFRSKLWGWWEAMFSPMRQQGHRFSYRNLLSGNFSLPVALFNQVGEFDPGFKCQEDYELGVRLIKAGANFTFAPDAMGYHHEITDLNRCLKRKYLEGQASIQLGCKYPELIYTLPVLSWLDPPFTIFQRLLFTLILGFPALGDSLANILRRCLDVLEWLKARGYWQKWLYQLMGYWFMRGVTDNLPDQSALVNFLQSQPSSSQLSAGGLEIDLQLEKGLMAAEEKLDYYRPSSVKIYYGNHSVGYVAPQPGYEALRGVHLRSILATTMSFSLLEALAIKAVSDQLQLWSIFLGNSYKYLDKINLTFDEGRQETKAKT